MKHLFLFLLALFVISFSKINAQTVQWVHTGTSPGYEYGNSIITDDSGNVYVSGQIEYTTHFDGGQILTSAGIHDIFAGKYAPDGSVKWLRSAGGPSGDVGYGVAVDGMHNCYATGEIEETARFSSGVTLTSNGGNDIFISKYGMNGQLSWAKSFGSTESDKGYSIIANAAGDIFVTGFYSAHIYFDNIHLTPAGLGDVYTMKLNTNGVVQWAKKGAGTEDDRGKGITFDSNGNIYVAGFFTGQATFSSSSITNNGTTGGFLVKYDPNGQLIWIKHNCCGTSEYDGIAIDDNDNIYTTGLFSGTVTIGNTTLTSSGSSDILIVKYDPSGNIIWAKKAGGPYEDMANAISIDKVNHLLYITGQLNDHGNFDSHYAGAAGNRDVFVAAYDLGGSCQWVKPYGGTQRDIGYGIANDLTGNIFTTGIYTTSVTFGNYNLTGDLLSDFYIEKIKPYTLSAPTTPSTNLTLNTVNCDDLHLNFLPGNGNGRIIVAHAGSPVNQFPVDGNSYNANSIFGNGDNLGSGNYVVYNGAGNSINVIGLTSGVTYYFAVCEFNGTGAGLVYLINNPAIASQTIPLYSIAIQSASNSICEGDTLSLAATGGGTYTWSPSIGLSAISGSVVNSFPSVTTTYTVVGNNIGCTAQNTITIIVNQRPVVSLTPLSSTCENGIPLLLNGGLPSGGNYSGPGISSGIFDPSISGTGAIPIVYTYTNSFGCSDSAISSITVHPSPVVTFTQINTLCENANSIVLTGGSPSGGNYIGSGVSSGIFDPSISGAGNILIVYTYVDSNGCSDSASSSITVFPTPPVSFTLNNNLCENVSPITLSGGLPYGGIYNGNGVLAGTFDPSITGTGNTMITYTYTDGNGCADSVTSSITVLAAPNISIGNDTTICEYNSIILNAGSGYSSYAWSNGSTQSSITIDSSGTGLGTSGVFVTVQNSYGCSTSDTIQVTFTICTGTGILNENAGLQLYPNPFSRTLNLNLDQSADIYIYDVSGRLVEKMKEINGNIEFGDNFSSGVYTVIVLQDKYRTAFRVVKNELF